MKIPAARVTIPEEDRSKILSDLDTVLRSGRLTLGPFTEEFERNYAEAVGTRHAVAVNSGTSALEIILRTIGVAGKKVLLPTNTFFATPAAALHAGGQVVFLDSSSHLMLDVDAVQEALDKNTGAVVVVHIGGYVHPDIVRLREICDHNHVPLVEDAAHAQGSTLDGKFAGTFGLAGASSFYPTKVMTSGEGGMITTNDSELATKAKILRDQGKAEFSTNYHVDLGYNWRIPEISAVLGVHQLRRLAQFVSVRRKIAEVYNRGLENTSKIFLLEPPPRSRPNFYKFVLILEKGVSRAELKTRLKHDYNVSLSGEVYEIPCHLQPVFQKLKIATQGKLEVAEDLCAHHVCLPVYSDMTEAEAGYVVDSLMKALT